MTDHSDHAHGPADYYGRCPTCGARVQLPSQWAIDTATAAGTPLEVYTVALRVRAPRP
jgi:hypothetical protein